MSLIIFAVVLIILWLIIEVVSIILKSTGMDLYKARFQAISIITHTGFTTRESELITQHQTRRKIASFLMIISYLAQGTLISVFINIMIQDTNTLLNVGVVVLILLIFIFLLTRTKYLSSRINLFVEKIIEKRILKATKKNPMSQVMKISPEFGIFEIIIDENGGLSGKSLMEANLKEDYIQVLKVDKGNETYDFPKSSLKLAVGDKLVVYGKIKSIKDVVMKQ